MFARDKKTVERNLGQGFTLTELMISVAVFAVIATVVIVGQSTFGKTVLFTNLAYDIALDIRQAQSSGINVSEYNPLLGQSFDAAYGIHFSSASQTSFVRFADVGVFENTNNGLYDGIDNGASCTNGSVAECDKIYTIRGGYKISKICAATSANVQVCSDNNGIASLDIVFKRPYPDAIISTKTSAGSAATGYKKASIYLLSQQGDLRRIDVNITGQISVGQ